MDDLLLVENYQRYAHTGVVAPLACPRDGVLLLPQATHEGVSLTCGLCDYSRIMGLQEKENILAGTRLAVYLINKELEAHYYPNT